MSHDPDPNQRRSASLSISCTNCVMRSTTHCDDCLVSFVLDGADDASGTDRPEVAPSTPVHIGARRRHPAGGRGTRADAPILVLDEGQARAAEMLARAGLVPGLRYELAG